MSLKCGKYTRETTSLEGARIGREKVVQITKLLGEGLGVRSIARVRGFDHHTVLNVLGGERI